MAEKWIQHVGDDQLIGGLPKHMSAVTTGEAQGTDKKKGQVVFWTVHPKPNACDKCKAMEGKKYYEEPERPHPNCKCRIEKHVENPPQTEWTFDGSSLCLKGGGCWAAVSGPHGKGCLPSGVYIIAGNATSVPGNQKSYCDKKGNCWWVPISPDFDAGGRRGFGIHPDGNVPGTLGCIGLTDKDTSDAFDALGNAQGQKIWVE